MFVCFFATTFTSFLLIFLCPLAVYSKLTSIPIAIFSLISALMTTIGTIIATAMWSIFKKEIASYQSEINIVPTVGRKMYVFIWIATGCSLLAAVGQIGMLCCGTSRRDIKSGRRVGRKQRTEKIITMEENPALRRRWWGSVSE
jgi:chromate transport protein ChrA